MQINNLPDHHKDMNQMGWGHPQSDTFHQPWMNATSLHLHCCTMQQFLYQVSWQSVSHVPRSLLYWQSRSSQMASSLESKNTSSFYPRVWSAISLDYTMIYDYSSKVVNAYTFEDADKFDSFSGNGA